MAYQKTFTTRARAITPSDTQNIPVIDATPANGTSAVIVRNGGGTILSITLVNVGLRYITAPTLTMVTGTGSGASLRANIDGVTGAITSITVLNGGTSYAIADTVTVSGGLFQEDQPCIVYVGNTGDVTVLTAGDDTVTFSKAQVGTILGGASPINVKRVFSTGTSASNLTAMW